MELALELLLAYLEWHEGVLRAESPAERAMCIKGRPGREKISWCVLTKRLERKSHRDLEYMVYVWSALGPPSSSKMYALTLYGSTFVSGGYASKPAARWTSGFLVSVFEEIYFCACCRASNS